MENITLDKITMIYNKRTGSLELYSDGGTLWTDWLEKAGISRENVTSICVAEGTVFLPENSGGTYAIFDGLRNARTIDLRGFNTSKVRNMYGMFENCETLTYLDLSGFDTSNVKNMGCMFLNCHRLADLNLSGLDVSKVTNMRYVFANCVALRTLNLSSFDTSNVTDMYGMFYGCKSLRHITANPTTNPDANTDKMFEGCTAEIT